MFSKLTLMAVVVGVAAADDTAGDDPERVTNGETVLVSLVTHLNSDGWEKIDPHSKTFLVNAATGKTKNAESLIQHTDNSDQGPGLMVKAVCPQKNNAAHLAAEGGHLHTLSMLLEYGVDGEGRNGRGFTPMHLAATQGHVDVIHKLCELGADADIKDDKGFTCFHAAVSANKVEAINEIVKFCEADMTIPYAEGGTALHFAAFNGHVEIVKALIKHGIDTELRDNDNMTALHAAAWGMQKDTAVALMHQGNADVDAIDTNGMSPLHAAAQAGSLEVTQLLLRNKASTLLKDKEGNFAMVYAVKRMEDGTDNGEADIFNAIHKHNAELFDTIEKKMEEAKEEEEAGPKTAVNEEADPTRSAMGEHDEM